MSNLLNSILAQRANEQDRTVSLSSGTLAVLLLALSQLEYRSVWLNKTSDPFDQVTDADWNEIEKLLGVASLDVMSEVDVTQLFPTFFEASPLHFEQVSGSYNDGTTLYGSFPYGVHRLSSTPANGDAYSVSPFLAQGDYTLVVWYLRSQDSGRMDVFWNGVKQGATVEMFGTTLPVRLTLAVSVSVAGIQNLTLIVNGKHASSSAYRLKLGGAVIYQSLGGGGI